MYIFKNYSRISMQGMGYTLILLLSVITADVCHPVLSHYEKGLSPGDDQSPWQLPLIRWLSDTFMSS